MKEDEEEELMKSCLWFCREMKLKVRNKMTSSASTLFLASVRQRATLISWR